MCLSLMNMFGLISCYWKSLLHYIHTQRLYWPFLINGRSFWSTVLVSAAMSQYDTHWLHHRGIRRRQCPPSRLDGVTSKKPLTVPVVQFSTELFQAQRNTMMGLDSTELARPRSIWQTAKSWLSDKGCMCTEKYSRSNQFTIWRRHCNLRRGVSNKNQLSGKPTLTEASPGHNIIKEAVAKDTAVSLSTCLSSFFHL
jgi:hypothetical protein